METVTAAANEAAELLDAVAREAAKIDAERAAYRRARAELAILDEYDSERSYRYGDYGGGQRAGELGRRRHELASLRARIGDDCDECDGEPTRAELREAFVRVGLPRIRRLERKLEHDEAVRLYAPVSRPARESLKAWRELGQSHAFDRSAHA